VTTPLLLANFPAGERPADGAGFAQELAGLVLALQDEHADPAASLAVVAEAAAKILPGADSTAVVAVSRQGYLRVQARCGGLAAAVADLQNELGEGPARAASRRLERVLVPDTAGERRWPWFGRRAAALGAAGLLAAPLSARAEETGSLALLLVSATPGALDDESARLATAFATHMSIALAAAQTRRQLGDALLGRDVIGQAKGILMERYKISALEAFDLLVVPSQAVNQKLRLVADHLTATGELLTPSSPGARTRPGEPAGTR
jgi:GAF domain-containing protein